jgi:hypothetical protein
MSSNDIQLLTARYTIQGRVNGSWRTHEIDFEGSREATEAAIELFRHSSERQQFRIVDFTGDKMRVLSYFDAKLGNIYGGTAPLHPSERLAS